MPVVMQTHHSHEEEIKIKNGRCAEETQSVSEGRFGEAEPEDAPKKLCFGGNLAEGNPKGAQAGAYASIRDALRRVREGREYLTRRCRDAE